MLVKERGMHCLVLLLRLLRKWSRLAFCGEEDDEGEPVIKDALISHSVLPPSLAQNLQGRAV